MSLRILLVGLLYSVYIAVFISTLQIGKKKEVILILPSAFSSYIK